MNIILCDADGIGKEGWDLKQHEGLGFAKDGYGLGSEGCNI